MVVAFGHEKAPFNVFSRYSPNALSSIAASKSVLTFLYILLTKSWKSALGPESSIAKSYTHTVDGVFRARKSRLVSLSATDWPLTLNILILQSIASSGQDVVPVVKIKRIESGLGLDRD